MATYTFTCTVPMAPNRVFDYLARMSNAKHWDPGVLAAEDLTPGEVRVGSRFALVVGFGRRQLPLEYAVTALVPGRSVVFEAKNRFVASRDTIDVDDAEVDDAEVDDAEVEEASRPGVQACRVRYHARLSGRGLGAFLEPVLAAALRHAGDQASTSLRDKLAGGLVGA